MLLGRTGLLLNGWTIRRTDHALLPQLGDLLRPVAENSEPAIGVLAERRRRWRRREILVEPESRTGNPKRLFGVVLQGQHLDELAPDDLLLLEDLRH